MQSRRSLRVRGVSGADLLTRLPHIIHTTRLDRTRQYTLTSTLAVVLSFVIGVISQSIIPSYFALDARLIIWALGLTFAILVMFCLIRLSQNQWRLQKKRRNALNGNMLRRKG